MRIDLHNHTTLCNHATGSIEEYIRRAIELKVDIYGFSEHAPMDFDEKYRVSFEDMHKYEKMVDDARDEFTDIEILKAYEVDWLPGHMDKRVLEADVDYLIGSVHFINKWGFDNPEFIGRWDEVDLNEIWQNYFDAVEQMADSGLFQIVGHFDLIKIFKRFPSRPVCSIAKKALEAIKHNNLTIEINSSGTRKPIGEPYPSRELLQEAFRMEIPICFGSDAHAVYDVGAGYKTALLLAKSVGYVDATIYRKKEPFIVPFS